MNYTLTDNGMIHGKSANGSGVFLPSENNDTPEWDIYKTWLDAGNTPEPAPEPPAPQELTVQEKLQAAGLTIEELKAALGL
jgi:hypothetical protein